MTRQSILKSLLFVATLLLWGAVHANTVTYMYTDPQGTPLAEADTNGNITATFDYRPYGAQALGTPPSGPGYTGHVNDPETDLVYMQARYYDPMAGRFLSVDPIPPAAGNGFNFNSYAYAGNNPILNMDPDGRDPCQTAVDCAARSKMADEVVSHDAKVLVHLLGGPIASLADFAHGLFTGNRQETASAAAIVIISSVVPEASEAKAVLNVAEEAQEVSSVAKVANAGEKVASQGPRLARGALRQKVLDKGRMADGSVKCAYCDKPTATTSDHVVPYSKDGPTTIDNLEPACPSCNSSKGSKDLGSEWIPPKDRE